MKITYVLTTADARAGTEKTFADQSRSMTDRGYDVTIASVYRLPERGFDFGDDVCTDYITDLSHAKGPASLIIPPEWDNQFCLAADTALLEYFRSCTADCVVTSTPALTLYALLACPESVKIVQEEHRSTMARGETAVPMLRHSPRVDAVVVLTERNRDWLSIQWGPSAPRLEVIPNALPATGRPQSSGEQKVVMGAGRLVRSKGFSNLVRAFARVADEFPEWRLRIFGDGPYRDQILAIARNLGIARQVELLPPTDHVEKEWARASIGALASDSEGLPLVLLEARGAGLPLVAFDCETGPREIIRHGEDGYLVNLGDISGFASALRILMENDELRAEMASGAETSLQRFAPEVVGTQWDNLYRSLAAEPLSFRQMLDEALLQEVAVEGSGGATLLSAAQRDGNSTTTNRDLDIGGGGLEGGNAEIERPGARGEASSDTTELENQDAGIASMAAEINESDDSGDERERGVIPCELHQILPINARENNRERLARIFADSPLKARAVLNGQRISWAVKAEDREDLLNFLCAVDIPHLEIRLYGGRTRLDKDGFSWRRNRREVPWSEVTRLFFFHHFSVPQTRHFVGYAGGVTVTIWDRDAMRPQLYRANRRNIEFDLLSANQFDSQLFARWMPMHELPLWSSVEFPVDAVYTWVDGADDAWRGKRAAASGDASPSDLAGGEIRFRNRDELRYSLRSLYAHAPWIRRIYIVTDGQRPSWLRDGDRVKIVDHRDLFPDPSVLPVFNSHAIETVLHRIPGLAEHFIYFNDDTFLLREQAPEAYFTSVGQAKFFPSPTKINDLGELAQPHEAAGVNNRNLLERDFGVSISQGVLHTPYPQRVSTLNRICDQYPEHVEGTRQSKFRSSRDISIVSSFAQHFGYLTGAYVQGSLTVDFVSLGSPSMLRKLSEVPHRSLDCLAFGEAEEDPRPAFTQEIATTFMRGRFQIPAPWEK
ncbi:stealth conserved region 3 domain-containing protein [Brachybacterium alimentarium]|uniref:stealth conserved region 3 domain-containing protein n=1 Tax=Brachybacterium alimentarium TaxID=47845 RepID=UPI003FD6701A